MKPPITVRVAHDDELDAAGSAVREAYTADGLGHGDYLDVIADARDRARDAEVSIALDEAGSVIGCVTFALPGSRWAQLAGPGEAEFRMLGVLPQARGRGVGEALTRWCVDRAQESGALRLLLASSTLMVAAHRLYRRLGFTRVPESDFTPVPGVDLLAFALELAQEPRSAALRASPARPVTTRAPA